MSIRRRGVVQVVAAVALVGAAMTSCLGSNSQTRSLLEDPRSDKKPAAEWIAMATGDTLSERCQGLATSFGLELAPIQSFDIVLVRSVQPGDGPLRSLRQSGCIGSYEANGSGEAAEGMDSKGRTGRVTESSWRAVFALDARVINCLTRAEMLGLELLSYHGKTRTVAFMGKSPSDDALRTLQVGGCLASFDRNGTDASSRIDPSHRRAE